MSGDYKPSRRGWMRAARPTVFAACLATSGLTAGLRAAGDATDPAQEARKEQLAFYGGGAMAIMARDLGVQEIMGKPLGTQSDGAKPLEAALEGIIASSSGSGSGPITEYQPARSANNVAIRDFPQVVHENEPTVAANPRNRNKVVAGTHFIGQGNRCVAHYSRDGGRTWSRQPIFMPQLTHKSFCSDPVLAYAPDGSRVYYAYMDIKATNFEIVVSWSDDDGKSWSLPVVALTSAVSDYDKPWIGTHTPVAGGDDSSQANSNWVYVSATRFDFTPPFGCHIDFTRSSDKGMTWNAPQTLDTSVGGCGSGPPGGPFNPVVQGSRPTGGLGGNVLVAWYNSTPDGWLGGSFQIRTRHSSNNGATFSPTVVAATETFELPFWLGPFAAYHRWWGGMFPDVEIAPNGSGHIAYTYSPAPQGGQLGLDPNPEDGDIRYIRSANAPYAAWSAPVTVNDDASGKAQGWATLEAVSEGSNEIRYALWEDHREPPPENPDNGFYDVFWAKRAGAGPWSPNEKLTDERSPSDFIFLGDYFDITVARGDDDDDHGGRGFVYGVWTDRRDEIDEFDFDDDVWGARIPPEAGDDDDD